MHTPVPEIKILVKDPNPPKLKPWVLAVTMDGTQLASAGAAEIMNQLRTRGRVQLIVTRQSVNDNLTANDLGEGLELYFNGTLTVDRESVTATVRELVSGGRRRCVLLTLTDTPEDHSANS